MRDVYAIGVGQSQFGRLGKTYTAVQLATIAVKAALKDAGIEAKKLQVAYGGQAIDNGGLTFAQEVLANFGVDKIEMINVFNACGTGTTATNLLYRDIANDVYDIGIAVGADCMTTASSLPKGKLLAPNNELDGLLGMSMPAYFALIAQRMMHDMELTREDLAYPSVKNHKNACLNPYAMYKKPLSTEEILDSLMISDPLTLLECCPSTDGAAAIILCSESLARQLSTKAVKIASTEVCSGYFEYPLNDITTDQTVQRLMNNAYEKLGIGPEDVDVVELHDAFSSEEISQYSSMGFCKREDTVKYMREGYFDLGGKVPVNPSGGLLALGHPIGASGVRVLNEIVLQVRGDAGEHQVEGAKVGAAQMLGGYLTGQVMPIAGGIQFVTK